MSKNLAISPDLSLPHDVVTSTSVIYGGKGMGKTNLASVVVEELAGAGLRWALLDPMGVAWGLRHDADGKRPGVSCVLLGGVHGDLPIEPTDGAVVAELVVEAGENVIVDFSRRADGTTWSKGEKIRFCTDYAVRLFELQGKVVGGRRREPLIQILDEAARYIPQMIPHGSPQLAECVGAWEQIAEEGRNFGLGVMFLTQRSARMNKSVSELADVMIAFRTVGPNSLEAIMDWLGSHVEKAKIRDLAARVRTLEVGEALVVSPGWLKTEKVVKIRARRTFDSSATPRPGQKTPKVTGEPARPNVDAYREKLSATVQRIKDNDPAELKRRIVALEAQARKAAPAQKMTIEPPNIEAAVGRALEVWNREMRQFDERIHASVGNSLSDVAGVLTKLEAVHANLTQAFDKLSDRRKKFVPITLGEAKRRYSVADGLRSNTIPISVSGGFTALRPRGDVDRLVDGMAPEEEKLARAAHALGDDEETTVYGEMSSGEAKVLSAILDSPDCDKSELTVVSGYKKTTRDTYLKRLKFRGYVVEVAGGLFRATDAGRLRLPGWKPLPRGRALVDYWLGRLPEGERKTLELLVEEAPTWLTRDYIRTQTGYKKTSSDTFVKHLKARRLAVANATGQIAANAILLETGGRR